MGVDQTRQQRLFTKIDHGAGIARFDLVEFSNIGNSISGNCDGAILNRRSIHRHDVPRANDHSAFTTFRQAATKRLHASWQSSGTVAGVAVSAVALAKADDPGLRAAWT